MSATITEAPALGLVIEATAHKMNRRCDSWRPTIYVHRDGTVTVRRIVGSFTRSQARAAAAELAATTADRIRDGRPF